MGNLLRGPVGDRFAWGYETAQDRAFNCSSAVREFMGNPEIDKQGLLDRRSRGCGG